ncbi:hypothetical protein JRO89_XS01G0105100 [Xanthoceras sorbifolium]|uniref:Uncharacterized protein n=1 Tax=Xanthoceras sorbifolium TaxID=99658 RepID=A0ABQ8IJ86_9ROSI|nr:hypothetical protein JRO89_XS01G0105100 [Xanthoceras sorbifolium]
MATMKAGLLKLPLAGNQVSLPGLPPLEPQDMPSFIYNFGSHPVIFEVSIYGQFATGDKADLVVEWLGKFKSLKTVGPTIPSMSMAELGAEQMEELAGGLKASDKYFLWVVRASEQAKLPENFVHETSQTGLVVTLSLGVPMVAVPQWTDKSTNAKYIMDVWKMGLKAKADEKGIVRREAMENCIREILDGERGKEIKNNADKWKRLAKEAIDGGGSSDKNIDEFVANLMSSKSCLSFPCLYQKIKEFGLLLYSPVG